MIEILTILHTLPNVKSYRTLCFERILSKLRSKTDVHITWLVYQPERLNIESTIDEYSTILDIHDFKNALDVVKQVKPDIIWAAPLVNLPDYALSIAGKFMKIPVVGEVQNQLMKKTSNVELLRAYSSGLFDNSIPTDMDDNNKAFMRRGKFFWFKFKFLIKTQSATKMNSFKIFMNALFVIKSIFSVRKELYNARFAVDHHFVEVPRLIDILVKRGYERTSLTPTGIPMYDDIFDRLEKVKIKPRTDKKKHILLLTHAMSEHGIWTQKQKKFLVQGIVDEISKHKDTMSLTVKIHPSSEVLSDYQNLIHEIDQDIIIHKNGDVMEFINNSDIIITYSGSSSLVYALVSQKPIIVCNFFNLENDLFIEKKLVINCKNISNLIESINKASELNPATKERVDSFHEEFFYKLDGLASERISNKLLDLLNKEKNNDIHE